MIRWRRQLPVYSPIPAAALAAAWSFRDARPALRDALARIYESSQVVLTGSGTMALSLALRLAASRRPGMVCVLPAYGCYDLATAAVGAGVRVRLYDINPRTLTPDESSLERALSNGAAALVAVHFYGIPAPLVALRAAAGRAGAMFIEDAAQGAGAAWQGMPLGSHAEMSVLSFGRGKGTTGGGGGALLINDPALSPLIDSARLERPRGLPGIHALKLVMQWAFGRPAMYSLPKAIPGLGIGETTYRAPEPLSDMAPVCARVICHTLRLAEDESKHRRAVAGRLLQAVAASRDFAPVSVTDAAQAGWLRFPVLARELAVAVTARLSHLGVQAGYPLPLNKLPEFAGTLEDSGELPGAAHLARHLVTFPTHGLLTDRDIETLEHALAESCHS